MGICIQNHETIIESASKQNASANYHSGSTNQGNPVTSCSFSVSNASKKKLKTLITQKQLKDKRC